MIKRYFNEFGNEQWVDEDTLKFNCTCQHGSTSRWEKGKDKPCICVWSALFKLAFLKQLERVGHNDKTSLEGIKMR